MRNSIQELNVYLTPKQQGIVNNLAEKNPLLATIPLKPASHGLYNSYSKVTDVDEMQAVDFDTQLPIVGVSTELGKATLGKIGGRLPIPMDLATEMGGYSKYANSKLNPIIAKSGNRRETEIYYNGFLQAALMNGQMVNVGGSTPNKQYSMSAVHWDEDSTTGLYDPNGINSRPSGEGELFETIAVNNGALYEVEALGGALGKTIAIFMKFGLQLADPRYVSALVNIEPKPKTNDPDKVEGLPTAMQLDDMIARVRGDAATTMIYCHNTLITMLANKYNLTQRSVTNETTKVTYTILEWNGIALIGSYNINWGNENVMILA